MRAMIVEPQGAAGIWHYAVSLSQALGGIGVEVVLATLAPVERDLPTTGPDIPIRVVGSKVDRGKWPPTVMLRRAASQVQRLSGIWSAVRDYRPNVVHIHDPIGRFDFLYERLLRSRGTRVVYTAHEVWWDGMGSWFDLARCRQANAVIVHSAETMRELALRGVPSERMRQIPHGNYLHFCEDRGLTQSDARRMLGLPAAARQVVLFFGAIAPYKGLDLLIEAFARLSAANDALYLVIAGRPKGDFSMYQRILSRTRVTHRVVKNLGYVPFDQFAKYFVAADVIVLPYRRISQSGILQLAYGFSKPVVVTDVGGLGEAVRADHTGVVSSGVTADGLAAAIKQVLDDPVAASVMGSRGRRLAETKYSWRTIATQLLRVYEEVCAEQIGVHKETLAPWS
ncbi:MAG TPA: glycosyltransferase family 4 protein [Anaerolineales bacterium]